MVSTMWADKGHRQLPIIERKDVFPFCFIILYARVKGQSSIKEQFLWLSGKSKSKINYSKKGEQE